MNCEDVRALLEAHADGELDLVRQLELEAHLELCPDCALKARGLVERRTALHESIPRFKAPRQLQQQVLASVRSDPAFDGSSAQSRPHIRWSLWNLGGMAASLAAALFLGYSWGNTRARADSLVGEAIADHVRSLQGGHLLDVISTDQHTVKPWFIGKLDFSPPVVDLADAGFPLAGGRLERLDGRTAAALVFHRRLHSINLLVWPAYGTPVPVRHSLTNGYNVESWSSGALNFMAISEIPSSELEQFTDVYRNRTQ